MNLEKYINLSKIIRKDIIKMIYEAKVDIQEDLYHF